MIQDTAKEWDNVLPNPVILDAARSSNWDSALYSLVYNV